MPADRLVVFFTCGLRNLASGMSSVMLGLYLTRLGVDKAVIGAIFTAALAGGALLTVAFSGVADRFGRRRPIMGVFRLLSIRFRWPTNAFSRAAGRDR